MNTTLLVVGIVVLVIGIIMLIIGIVVHENNVANNQGQQPWWVWFLIIAGIIIAIIGGFMMAFSSTRKSPPKVPPPVVYATPPPPRPMPQVQPCAPACNPCAGKPQTGVPIPTSNPYYLGQPASYGLPPVSTQKVVYTDLDLDRNDPLSI